ncbi:MAG TPA: hypothetical protein VM889_07145 [Candidatus Thermoplasmatota archaeon]|nr:hypothetical protein [Candidatus Thermoplasmatota archaeon]
MGALDPEAFDRHVRIQGDLHLDAAEGVQVSATCVDVAARGSFRSPEGPIHLFVETSLGEVRRLAKDGGPAWSFVGEAAGPDAATARLALAATPDLMTRLAEATPALEGEPQARDLLASAGWLEAALALAAYEPVELALETWEA